MITYSKLHISSIYRKRGPNPKDSSLVRKQSCADVERNPLHVDVSIYVLCMHVCVYIYIYIYNTHMYICIYVCVYIYIYMTCIYIYI